MKDGNYMYVNQEARFYVRAEAVARTYQARNV